MIYEYDKETDGLYIWFVKDIEKEKEKYENEVWPSELKNEIGLLFDTNSKLMGLEVQPASKYFNDDFLNVIKKETNDSRTI